QTSGGNRSVNVVHDQNIACRACRRAAPAQLRRCALACVFRGNLSAVGERSGCDRERDDSRAAAPASTPSSATGAAAFTTLRSALSGLATLRRGQTNKNGQNQTQEQ